MYRVIFAPLLAQLNMFVETLCVRVCTSYPLRLYIGAARRAVCKRVRDLNRLALPLSESWNYPHN
jgi:hypothetical protein